MTRSEHILIIDDDRDDREYIEEAFVDLDVQNERIYVSSASEALAYIESHSGKPFLIISDINMPVMNGFELRKIILENSDLTKRCSPYIFLSTSGSDDWVNKAFELSAHGYFKKPAAYSDLKTIVHSILNYWNSSLAPVL